MSSLFNKTDYVILQTLTKNGCISPMASLTRKQIENATSLSETKIRTAMKAFLLTNIVKEGTKDGKCKTYFVSEDGIKHCMDVFGLTREEILDED